MSDPQPITGNTPPPLGAPVGAVVGYCRACGKALDAAAVRAAHGTIYCADHVPADPVPGAAQFSAIHPGAAQAGPASAGPYAGSPYASPYAGGPYAGGAYTSPYANGPYTGGPSASPYTNGAPPPLPHQDVSPGLAFLLGLIPGVGAVYNGQYAKGLVHVVIVGLIISILSNGAAEGLEALLGLLLAAFFAYMAFEAYHTARRRQLGQPVDEFSGVLPGRGGRFPAAPVVVITLGVVFLLSNLQILEIRRLLRYWPVLMIGLGVYMLFARLSGGTNPGGGAPGGPTPNGPAGMGADRRDSK